MTYGVYPCSKCGYNYPTEPPDDIHTILRVGSCPVGDSIKQEYECGNCHAMNERYWDLVHFVNIIDKRESTVDAFLLRAINDVSIFGITLEDTLRSHIETVKAVLNSQVESFRVLLCDPKSRLLKEVSKQVGININTISSSIEGLRDLKSDSDINAPNLKKLHIRTFNGIPVQSIFIIDQFEEAFDDATARFEPYIYGITKQNRFLYEVPKFKNKQLFQSVCMSYDKMWEDGNDVHI